MPSAGGGTNSGVIEGGIFETNVNLPIVQTITKLGTNAMNAFLKVVNFCTTPLNQIISQNENMPEWITNIVNDYALFDNNLITILLGGAITTFLIIKICKWLI